jgi:hypothetical protein
MALNGTNCPPADNHIKHRILTRQFIKTDQPTFGNISKDDGEAPKLAPDVSH